MNTETQGLNGLSIYEAVTKIIQPCLSLLKFCTFGHQVHPLEPITPQYSEYISLSAQKRLRIINVKAKPSISSSLKEIKGRHCSSSQDYWFMRWSKPLKLSTCSCSFRRSQRCYISQPKPTTNSMSNKTWNKIKKIEGFVDRLIEETFSEAIQESFKKLTAKTSLKQASGAVNLAFVDSENLPDVVLRHAAKQVGNSCQHVDMVKSKKKPVILFLHGIGDSADVWWNIINIFVCCGYEVVAPDMLGHGYSSVPNNVSDYKFQSILQYTLVVFDRYIGCDDSSSCIIVAHSYGCSLATALCQHRSQQIIQLILISGGGPTPLAPPSENEVSGIHCLHNLIKPLLFCGIQRTILYPIRGKNFEACNSNNGVPNYVLQYIKNGQDWPEGDASFHRRILIPTLLVHGLLDDKVTLVQECEMERTIPRAFLEIIPNAGHISMLDAPEHLGHMIMCFIEWWSNGEF